MKYRIRIEQLDYNHNLLHQSQCEVNSEMIQEMKNKFGIDAIEESFKRLNYEFQNYIKNEK